MTREPHAPLTMADWDEMAKITTDYPDISPYPPGVFDWLTFGAIAVIFFLGVVSLAFTLIR